MTLKELACYIYVKAGAMVVGKRKNNQEDGDNEAPPDKSIRRQNVRLEWEPVGWLGSWGGHHWDWVLDRREKEMKKLGEHEGWHEWYQPAFYGQIYALSSPGTARSGLSLRRHKSRARSNEVNADTSAFNELKSRLRSPSIMTQRRTTWPSRLINIPTGQVESSGTFSRGENPPYIIGSYIWSPQELPKYPRLKRRERKVLSIEGTTRDYSNDDWEYSTDDFDAVVDLVKAASRRVTETPNFWIIEEDDPLVDYERIYPPPCLDNLESDAQRAYIKEVYYLLVVEAHLMGLQYVWLDSLCINQNEPRDVEEEIPRMADYYQNSTRCVVVSEMLRRGYSHRLGRLGYDFLDATYDDELPPENLTEAHRELCGIEDEVLGWIVGFHQLRVWVFQETYLAKSIVHRGRHIRLNTRDILIYGIRLPEYSQGPPRIQHHCRKAHQKRLPICLAGGNKWTANHCMSLIRQQRRKTLKEKDYIFSILGLFPQAVRKAIPVQYDVTLPAISAMLIYARVATGDPMALFRDEDQLNAAESHSIRDSPSWLPRTYAQMSFQEDHPSACPGWPGLQPPNVNGNGTFVAKSPYYRVTGLRRANATDVEKSKSQGSEFGNGDGKIMDCGGGEISRHEIEQDYIMLEVQVLPSTSVHLYFRSRLTRGEMAAWRLLRRAIDMGSAVIACIEAAKYLHHWLVLTANDASRATWKLVGHLETGHIHHGISYCGDNAPPSHEFHIT